MQGKYGDDLEPLLLRSAESFTRPCVGLFCNGCGEVFDWTDSGATHADPDDPMTIALSECDWLEIGVKHYCPECHPPFCDDCDERHDGDCPEPPVVPTRQIPVIPGQTTIDDALAEVTP
jgi:hypothetical protein